MPLTDEIAQQGVDREGALFNSRQALQSWWQTGDECQIHSQQSDWQDFFVMLCCIVVQISCDFLTIGSSIVLNISKNLGCKDLLAVPKIIKNCDIFP